MPFPHKERALQILKAKLYDIEVQKQMQEINKLQAFIDKQRGKFGKIAKQAQSREKLLEKKRANLVAPPTEKKNIVLDLKPNREEDLLPVCVEDLFFAYSPEKKVIKNLHFH